jgi:hypothetical protein
VEAAGVEAPVSKVLSCPETPSSALSNEIIEEFHNTQMESNALSCSLKPSQCKTVKNVKNLIEKAIEALEKGQIEQARELLQKVRECVV